MDRFFLTDAQWAKMQPFCLGKASDPGRTGETPACSPRPCCGSHARAVHGGIAAIVWELELGFQTLPGLGQGGRVQAHVRGGVR